MNVTEIRQDSWDQAIYAFGTAAIFQKRAKRLKRRLNTLTFLGIVVPVLVGGIAMSFGTEEVWFKWLLYMAAFLGLGQLVGSVWSLVERWEDNHAYCLASAVANDRLSVEFSDFAKAAPTDESELKMRFSVLKTENQIRRQSDNQQNIEEAEKRYGMRAALRQFKRPCSACKQVPTSMNSTSCGVCGNF